MLWFVMGLLVACGTPAPERIAEKPVVEEPESMPLPTADWSDTLAIAAIVSRHYVANSVMAQPPRPKLAIDDPVADRVRSVGIRKQHEVAMAVDADTIHWLVEFEDADTKENVVLDYTIDWRPSKAKIEDPSTPTTQNDMEVVAIEIQAVDGKERHRWEQDGEIWVRREIAAP